MNPFKKKNAHAPVVILDTCALIDGRIVDIARAGFVPEVVIIPQFVVAELQFLADKGDSYKRERARFGLDVARNLQDIKRIEIDIAREKFEDIKEVDDKLIALAKLRGGMLYTTDYNLNKVAQIEGITVLNVNELAQALRPNRLPGERVEIKLTQIGQDKTQGVGYLEDGTMVVVEKAASMVGQRILVEFSRVLQTQAGKMMFAVLPKNSPTAKAAKKPEEVIKAQHGKPQQHTETEKKPQKHHNKPKQHQKTHNKPVQAHTHTVASQPAPAQPKPNPNRQRRRRVTPEDKLLRTLNEQQD